MEWIESLSGQLIGLDTAPLIYFVEEHPRYLATVRPFFQAIENNEFRVVTSTITLTEVLIHPLRQRDAELARQYREILLNSPGIFCVPLSAEVAEKAAQLRSEHNLRTPDAIHLATAYIHSAAHFLTNDSTLPNVPEVQLIVLDNLGTSSDK
ncbi:MAG: twitching motility protein PilT [SAR202 cluster bacterium Io17-Chloro-G4]|nr:MAG: twitching motility protein PilT [SAR202 cluster bacterium Io17-Chloro-G4]